MRTAICNYIPQKECLQGDIEERGGSTMFATSTTVKWVWQETPGYMDCHAPNEVYGDPKNCWILYTPEATRILEDAYQNGSKKVNPLPGYVVRFKTMEQTKINTGFKRSVQRIDETVEEPISKKVDVSDVDIGDMMPPDLQDEPCMVLVEGDVIQISQQREDGWAFGTKVNNRYTSLFPNFVFLDSMFILPFFTASTRRRSHWSPTSCTGFARHRQQR